VTPAEAREVAADLTDDTPTIMPDGRMRNLAGPQWRPSGVHRRGLTPGRGEVRWYETVTEWFERTAT
jgi:hypothetical protein